MIRTAFFGSSSYVLPVLESLKKNTDLRLVVTRPDKPTGRKKEITPSPPKQWAQKHHIRVVTSLQLQAVQEETIELAMVADYGELIPKRIFDYPRWKTINIHFSKLPDLIGPSPVQWTILRGDKSSWITFFLINEELDTGDILFQHEVPLSGHETTGELYAKLFDIAATILPEVLNRYTQGKITPKPQDDTKATFTRRLTRADGFIPLDVLHFAMEGRRHPNFKPDFFPASSFPALPAGRQLPASILITRLLRAFTPWPGVWTQVQLETGNSKLETRRLKILNAHVQKDRLILDQMQLEGKRPVSWNEFTKGHPQVFSSRA